MTKSSDILEPISKARYSDLKFYLILTAILLFIWALILYKMQPDDSDRYSFNSSPGNSSVHFETYFVKADAVNLRQGPSLNSYTLTKLYRGTKVEVILKQDNEWWKVRFNGVEGYIRASFLSANVQASSTSAVSQENSAGTTETITNNATNLMQCSQCEGTGIAKSTAACTYCHSSGYVVCTSCDGSRGASCQYCEGARKLQCTSCGGEGSKVCYGCGGDGNNVCPACGGGGTQRDGMGKVFRCHGCSGVGYLKCSSCSGAGKFRCFSCAGTGSFPCQKCNSRGNTACNMCTGSGRLTCSNCSGKGEQTSTATCSACKGSGQVEKI